MKLYLARRVRRRLAAIIGVGILATSISACGGSSNADAVSEDGTVDLSKVTLTVGDQKGGSQALLGAAGELDKVEYEIEWKPFTSGPPLLDALGGGSVDVGSVGNTPPLFAIDEGKDLRVVSAARTSARGDAIVLPKDSTISSIKQLEGKKVAVAKGSSANYHLLAQLAKAGLDFDDIEPVYLQPTEGLAAFKGGHVDAWAIWDPFTAQAQKDNGAKILVDGEGVVNGLGFQVASDEALDDKATKAAIKDYLSRIARAQLWTNKNSGVWAKTWADDTGLSPAVTAEAVKRRKYTPIPIDDDLVASEQTMWDAFRSAKQLRSNNSLEPHFVDDFNTTVLNATKGAS